MLNKLKKFFTKHKYIIITLSIVIFAAIVVFMISEKVTERPGAGLAPVITKEEKLEKPKFPFNLIEVSPPSGDRETFDYAEYIYFKFSAPINAGTIEVKVTPTVKLKPTVNPTNPYTLILIPEPGNTWLPNRRYTVVIKASLTSLDGVRLTRDITYKYYNDPPTTLYYGEGDSHLK